MLARRTVEAPGLTGLRAKENPRLATRAVEDASLAVEAGFKASKLGSNQ